MNVDGDRGLIGKVLVLWLLVLALIGLVAFDAGAIVLTRVRVADLAGDASAAAAEAFERTGSEEAAKLAALQEIADADQPARLRRIDVRADAVSVVLVARAGTLVVGRVPLVDDLASVTVTDTSGVSG